MAIKTPCASHDPELWFSRDPYQIQYAQALCSTCPVTQACFEVALANGERHGVWGGRRLEELRERTRGIRRGKSGAVAA